MPTLTLRKAEVAALLQLWEPGGLEAIASRLRSESDGSPEGEEQAEEQAAEEWAEAQALARDLLKEAYRVLLMRDEWYVVLHQLTEWRPGGLTLTYGFFGTQKQAEDFARTLGGGSYRLSRFKGAEAFTAGAAEILQQEAKFDDTPCTKCGHLEAHHGAWKTVSGKTTKYTPKQQARRCSAGCSCPGYTTDQQEEAA